MLIDETMPTYDASETHSRVVNAGVSTTWETLLVLRPEDIPVARLLFTLRSLPGLVAGRDVLPVRSDATLLSQFQSGGFCELGRRPPVELALGLVGRFWTLGGGVVAVSPAEFAAFDRPGYARAVMSFSLSGTEDGCTIRTETRVQATDDAARTSFRRYWRVIGPFSGLTRREWLRAIASVAEETN